MVAFPDIQVCLHPMKLRYREDKATQAAAILLKLGGGKLNLMQLIKLLYFAERRAVLQWGRPITFDELWSLRNGPVLSATLDNINSEPLPNTESYWLRYVTPRDSRYDIALKSDNVPNDQLSPAEEKLLADVYREFGHLDQWKLRDYAHNHFPEWRDPGNSRYRISIRDILLAEGYSASDADEIEHQLRGEALLDAISIT